MNMKNNLRRHFFLPDLISPDISLTDTLICIKPSHLKPGEVLERAAPDFPAEIYIYIHCCVEAGQVSLSPIFMVMCLHKL